MEFWVFQFQEGTEDDHKFIKYDILIKLLANYILLHLKEKQEMSDWCRNEHKIVLSTSLIIMNTMVSNYPEKRVVNPS